MADSYSVDLERDSSQYIRRRNNEGISALKFVTTGTIECYINLESLPSVATKPFGLVSLQKSTHDSWKFYIDNADNKPTFEFRDSSGNSTKFKANTAFIAGDLGTWVHLAAVVAVGTPTITFYRNGSADGSNMISNAATSIGYNQSGSDEFRVGLFAATTQSYFDGLLDEVRVWNTLRSSSDISGNYQQFLSGTETGLVGYWVFNLDYNDKTIGLLHLTAINSPVFSSSHPFDPSFVVIPSAAITSLQAVLGAILISGTATVSPAAAIVQLSGQIGAVLIVPGALRTKKIFSSPFRSKGY